MAARDKFALSSGKRRIIDHKVHGNGGFGNFLERNRFRPLRCAQRISYMDIRDTGDGNDGADTCFADFYFIQTVKFIELADFYAFNGIGIVMVDDNNILIDAYFTIVYLADADASDIFIIVDGADKQLQTCVRVASGAGI